MILSAEEFTIRLNRTFRIAHGASDKRGTILVHLRDDEAGITAHGEGALPPYYPSTAGDCLAWLDGLVPIPDDASIDDQLRGLPAASPGATAAFAALDIALHDLWAQRLGEPIWRLWRLDPARTPPCAWTVSIASSETDLREMLDEGAARGCNCFKLKAGSGDPGWDEHCVRLARARHPAAILSVDANGAWSAFEATHVIAHLAPERIAYFEQPVAREPEAWRDLRELLPERGAPPLVADESVQDGATLAALRGLADGINIKLLKAGGLSGARRWAVTARRLGFGVMIGVMIETGIGRTAAAQLAPLADWLDIDSPSSVPAEPLAGFRIVGDRLVLSNRAGLGLVPVPGSTATR